MGRDNEGVYWTPIHVQRVLDDEKILYSSVHVVYLAVLIRRYQPFLFVIKVSNMMESVVTKYGL